MHFTSPIDAFFQPLAFDKFWVVRPPNIDPSNEPHTGVDLRPHENGGSKNVMAIADGVITVSTPSMGSYYAIQHNDGWQSLYVHMNRPLPVGTQVKQGQIIGTYQDGPASHLHLTLRKDGVYIDPEQYINFNGKPLSEKEQLKIEIYNEMLNAWRANVDIYLRDRGFDLSVIDPEIIKQSELYRFDIAGQLLAKTVLDFVEDRKRAEQYILELEKQLKDKKLKDKKD